MENYNELIKKADSGDTVAQLNLADAYFNGYVNGVSEIGKGLKYMEMAANSGNPKIQSMYANLLCIAGLDKEAFLWLEKAALQGDPESQGMLSKYYFAGTGINKNDQKALLWAQRAYDNGDRDQSCVILGTLYLQGKVVNVDGIKAYNMFKIAAQNGNEQAAVFKKQMEDQLPQLRNMQ